MEPSPTHLKTEPPPWSSRTETCTATLPTRPTLACCCIDMINDLDFPEGDMLLRHALPMARRLVDLKRRARTAGVPVIYVNDNFGRWRSNFNSQVEHCMKDGVRGEAIVKTLVPEPEDYFVLKPKHSGFFSTTLDTCSSIWASRR